MSEPKPIYCTAGDWMAVLYEGNLFDTQGDWVAWLDGDEVYSLEGDYVGYVSEDGRLLRARVAPYRRRRRPPDERPPFEPLKSVPLPPMFAELHFSVIDVFEETPDVFATIGELQPDSGERALPRLVDVDPDLAVQQKLLRVEQNLLEDMAYGLLYSYGVTQPPVPIEAMAAGLDPENAAQTEVASPRERLNLAEGLVERLGRSSWARERGFCGAEGFTRTQIQYVARALLVPRHWIQRIPPEFRHAATLAARYSVPEEDVILRLHDLE